MNTNTELIIALKQKIKEFNNESFNLKADAINMKRDSKSWAEELWQDAYKLEIKSRAYHEVIDIIESTYLKQ